MRMSEGAHVLELLADARLVLVLVDGLLGDVLHRDLVSRDDMPSHCEGAGGLVSGTS